MELALELVRDNVLAAIATALVGGVLYLIRSYFGALRKDIADARADAAKSQGYLESLQAEIRANTVELARVTTELKAVWRWVDAPKRTTDNTNGGHP